MNVFKKLECKYPRTLEILRFLLIGGLATAIDLLIMSFVIYLPNRASFNGFLEVFANKHIASGWLVAFASAMGFIVGLVFNYIFSLKFVYKGDNNLAKTKKGFIVFTVLSVIGLIIETSGVYLGYSLLHINEWLIKIILIFVVLIFNYITRKKFLFKDSTNAKTFATDENIQFNDKDKRVLLVTCLSILFVVYVIFSLVYVYYINSVSWEFLFGCDSPRVLEDWTMLYANHYRTKVHPLYVLFVFPFASVLMFLGLTSTMSVILLTALIATLNVYFLYKILDKLLCKKPILAIIITIFYALSFTVLENLMIIESFTFSLFTILVFWYYFIYYFKDFKLNIKNAVILTLLGVLCFSMLLTNYFHYLLGLLFLVVFNKKKKFKELAIDFLKYIGIIFLSMLLSVILILVQKFIFASSENAITYIINIFLDMFRDTKHSEEFSYINFSINGTSFLNILIYFFGIAFAGGSVENGRILTMKPNVLTIVMIVIMLLLTVFSLYKIIRNKKFIALPIIIIYGFEMVLHLFYGNNELMLYINQSSFLLLIIIAFGLSDIDIKHNKLLNISALAVWGISIIQTALSCLRILIEVYNRFGLSHNSILRNNFKFIVIMCFSILAFLALYLIMRRQKFKTLINRQNEKDKCFNFVLLIFISIIIGTIMFSTFLPQQVVVSGETATVETMNINNPEQVMMGMGQRKKFVLERTNAGNYNFYNYNLSNKEKINVLENLSSVNYDPLNYSISCLDENGNSIQIYENELGIYLNNEQATIALDDDQYINIPNYHGLTYNNYLRILFYEVMVNVLPNGFTPNYLTYGNFWYRDGALMSMVLEKTDNLSQLKLSVDVDDVYDGARGGVNEPDNLGELLYMLSLQDETNWTVVNAVLSEAEIIKQADNCIHGITDGEEFYVYQTTWLKFGMERLGLNSSAYDISNKSDNYSSMCWWYNRDLPENYPHDVKTIENQLFDISKTYYPYLEIAKLHYYGVKIELPNNLNYPISFEYQDWGLARQEKCSPHSWSASELFLYLLEYDQF